MMSMLGCGCNWIGRRGDTKGELRSEKKGGWWHWQRSNQIQFNIKQDGFLSQHPSWQLSKIPFGDWSNFKGTFPWDIKPCTQILDSMNPCCGSCKKGWSSSLMWLTLGRAIMVAILHEGHSPDNMCRCQLCKSFADLGPVWAAGSLLCQFNLLQIRLTWKFHDGLDTMQHIKSPILSMVLHNRMGPSWALGVILLQFFWCKLSLGIWNGFPWRQKPAIPNIMPL